MEALSMREKICRVILAMILTVGITQSVSAQTISAIPRATRGYSSPYTFFDACNNMSTWPTVGARTSGLGSFWHDIDAADDTTLSTCISNINNAGLTFTLESPTYGGTGGCSLSDCYAATYNTVSRLISLGMSASQIRVRMQEPLTEAHKNGCGGCNDGDVVNYVVTYLSWLRSDFPGIQVSSIEAFPYISLSNLNWWIAALDAACEGAGVIPPDAFEIDHNMNENAPWSWSDISSIISTAHSAGWVAGYIFGSPVIPGRNWQYTANIAGANLRNNGIVPDAYVFESWEASDPYDTIPETVTSGYTFMSEVKYFIDHGLFPW
jgi:hypothetical protein